MRKSFLILVGLVFVMACGGGPTPEEMASLAAKGYYEHLLRGEYDRFLEGKDGADGLPDDYRQQLVDAYKQFIAQQEKAHHGIQEIRVVNAQTDTALHYTNVFLVLCFGDSTNEQVAVPMINRSGSWRMR